MGNCPQKCPWQASCNGNITERLYHLLNKAYTIYRKEVVECRKLYRRFTTDFLNGHRYTDAVCAAGRNAHETATGIISDLFNIRPDLVRDYFAKLRFSHAEPGRAGPTETTEGKTYFMSSLSEAQKAALAVLAVKVQIFKGEISVADISALLDCQVAKPLKSANNGRGCLYDTYTFFCHRRTVKPFGLILGSGRGKDRKLRNYCRNPKGCTPSSKYDRKRFNNNVLKLKTLTLTLTPG